VSGGAFVLRNARVLDGGALHARDVAVKGDTVATVAEGERVGAIDVELDGRVLLPALVNAHDHLDFSTFPLLGRPPYASAYEWSADVNAGASDPRAARALAVPPTDRLFLGGVRNLLSGVAAVAHHNAFHRSLARDDFPVHVIERYQFAHSPGLTTELKRTYRSSDRRIPWMVHAAEGTDERSRGEVQALARLNLLRENTVIVHGIGLGDADRAALAEVGASVVWCPESNRILYGVTADVRALRAAGVRVGLGSDSPVSGVRDPLSNLAAARREGVLEMMELVELATQGAAAVARLPVGGTAPGDRADLLAVPSLETLLAGERGAVDLVVRAGRALYAAPALAESLLREGDVLTVDGHARRTVRGLGRRTAAIVKAHPRAREAAWLAGIGFPGFD
jgi:cytosine/adenosine deaminase-related metal-dependent hydrolase